MPSRTELWRGVAALLLCAALSGARPAAAQQAAPPDLAQIEAARETVRQDPNLGTERTVNTLRWDSEREADEDSATPGWLAGLFRWLGQSARLVIWVLAGLLAAVIVIYLLRLLRDRRAAESARPLAPTHVRELDIRPESLPADIGAAARQLWDAGETRRALALLYRGLLSRLVHAHAAPVRESTTEGESVQLARRCLPAAGSEFAGTLVGVWQLAVYGRRTPDTATVHQLCAGFAAALDAPAQAPAPAQGGGA